jgi:peptidoglycan/LPS O-acetylase OafA/YrhL
LVRLFGSPKPKWSLSRAQRAPQAALISRRNNFIRIEFGERLVLAAANQGWPGVNLFFVLSGFLITGILLDRANKPNFYSRFYYRRALRILPAYYLLLLMLIVLGHISSCRDTRQSLSSASVSYISRT